MGKVIKVAADFMGLLVLGVFNASVAADCIRPEFKCDHNVGVQGRSGRAWARRVYGGLWGYAGIREHVEVCGCTGAFGSVWMCRSVFACP